MAPRVLLLGPGGQLGHDLRIAHARSGGDFVLSTLSRERLDFAVPGAVERVLHDLDFDILVNCAAYTRVDDAEGDASHAFAVNAQAVGAMARLCESKRARLVHVSTDYVFGGDIGRCLPLPEQTPTAPVNIYGASKAMGETLARLESEDVVVLRVASLFGHAGVGGKGGNFVETVIRTAKERRYLRVVDDQSMSPTSTSDVAQVLVRMLLRGCVPGIYHVVNDGSATWFEFACEILRRTAIDAEITPCSTEDYPMRAARPRYCVLDNARISADFGSMPAWQDALERYLRTRGHV